MEEVREVMGDDIKVIKDTKAHPIDTIFLTTTTIDGKPIHDVRIDYRIDGKRQCQLAIGPIETKPPAMD